MTSKTSNVPGQLHPLFSKASAVQRVRPDTGRNFSAFSGEVDPHVEQPMSIRHDLTSDQANFIQALQQQASAFAYLLPPSLDVSLISLTKVSNGLSARLLVLYEDDFDNGKVVVVAGPDKEATICLHRRLYRSMNKEKIVTRKQQGFRGSLLWFVIGCVVVGAVGFFVALAGAVDTTNLIGG